MRRNNAYPLFSNPFTLLFVSLYLINFLSSFLKAEERKVYNLFNTDPSVSQFQIVRGDGDPAYNGDINFEIPLMTVPGRGNLNFDLVLQYVHGNGVPASESASWVGLGWNLHLPQITCSPVAAVPSPWVTGNNWHKFYQNTKDIYHLSFPGGATPFMDFGTGDFTPLKWSAIKIEGVDYAQKTWVHGSETFTFYDYDYYIVTDLDGTRYVFKEKLVQTTEQDLICHPSSSNGANSAYQTPYYFVFKLTAILGTNYVDGSITPDLIPGNGGEDKGSWITFEYSTAIPFSPPTGAGNFPVTEINYLSAIKTPTHSANFVRNSETHAYISSGHEYWGPSGSDIYLIDNLDKIRLTPIDDNTEYIKTVKFNTSRSFGTVYFDTEYFYYHYNESTYHRRLRLNSLEIYGPQETQAIPTYKFAYYPEPKVAHGSTNAGIDNWGYFKYDNEDVNIPDTYEPDSTVTRWLLKRVTYPEGAEIEFVCESDQYQTYFKSPRGSDGDNTIVEGGIRLIQKKLYDPQADETQTYSYTYALENVRHPYYGFISSEPTSRDPEGFGGVDVALGQNLNNDVHYPDVRITLPDGSKIHRFYTSAMTAVKLQNRTGTSRDFIWIDETEQGENEIVTHDLDSNYDNWPSGFSNCSEAALPFWKNLTGTPAAHDILGIWTYLIPFREPEENLEIEFNATWPPSMYTSANEGFTGKSAEFDDANFEPVVTDLPDLNIVALDNSWKRGILLIEKLIPAGASENPVEIKKYYYSMIAKNTDYYCIVLKRQKSGQSVEDELFPAFITSGWARLEKVKVKKLINGTSDYCDFKIDDYEYNTTNGLVNKIKSPGQILPNGQVQPKTTKTKFAFEAYSTMENKHQLSQVAQETINDGVLYDDPYYARSSSVTTWKQASNGYFMPSKTYQWLEDDRSYSTFSYEMPTFNFTGWVDTGEPDPTDDDEREWIKTSKVLSWDDHGNEVEIEDAQGKINSVRWGEDGALPIAIIKNAQSSEVIIEDFSDGNIDDNDPMNWGTYGNYWVNTYGCLTWNTSSNDGYVYNTSPFSGQGDFIAEYDIKINDAASLVRWGAFQFRKAVADDNPWESGFMVLCQKDGWVKLYDCPRDTCLAKVNLIKDTNKWHHIKIQVNDVESDTRIQVWVDNKFAFDFVYDDIYDYESTNSYFGYYACRCNVQFDNLRIYPLDALCTSRTIDPISFLTTSRTDENGIRKYYEYDSFNRLSRTLSNSGLMTSENIYYYSRYGNGGNFSSSDPNYITTVVYPEGASFDGFIGWWNLESSARDTSGNENHGTVMGAHNVHGFIGEGYSFQNVDGSGDYDYIEVPADPGMENLPGLSMCAWVYPFDGIYGINSYDIIVCKEDEYEMAFSADNSLISAVHTNSSGWFWTGGTGNNTLPKNKWTFVSVTWDGSNIREYINGELKNTEAQTGTTTYDANGILRIGGRTYDPANDFWKGKIDEVKIYKRALSSAEIYALFNANITITFSDGLGRPIQTKKRIDDYYIVSRTEYNEMGDVYKEYKPQKISDSYSYVTPINFNSDTCETFTYYADPLKRLEQQQHFDGTTIQYFYGLSDDLNGITEYRYEKVKDECGNNSITFFDNLENTVGGFRALGNNDDEIKWIQYFDIMGNMSTNRPPNYWSDETSPGQWESKMRYNTLSQVYEKTTPDEGTVKYIYDSGGNLRYSQSAVQAAAGDDFTVYYYDEFNRTTLIGEETVKAWEDNLDLTNTSWGTDKWKIRNYYDKNFVPDKVNYCRNQLTKVEKNTDADTSVEHTTLFVYDENGNITEKRIIIDSGSPLCEKIIQYEYDLIGNEKKIIYPSGNTIIKQYNQQGQIKKISTVN